MPAVVISAHGYNHLDVDQGLSCEAQLHSFVAGHRWEARCPEMFRVFVSAWIQREVDVGAKQKC